MHARGVRTRARVAPRGMNQPNRADRFVLPEGERKLSYERDTKVENAGTFVLQRGSHVGERVTNVRVKRRERKGWCSTRRS